MGDQNMDSWKSFYSVHTLNLLNSFKLLTTDKGSMKGRKVGLLVIKVLDRGERIV